jgi:hypothetical protein
MKVFEIKDRDNKFTTLVIAEGYSEAEKLYYEQVGQEIDTIRKREESVIMEIRT